MDESMLLKTAERLKAKEAEHAAALAEEGKARRAKAAGRNEKSLRALVARALGTNREYARLARKIVDPAIRDLATKGEINVYRLHARVRGDDRVSLTVKIPPALRDNLRALAKRDHEPLATMVTRMLRQCCEDW